MPKISRNAHDQNFKALMSEPDFLNDFLKAYLPQNLQRLINLNTAEITPRPLKHLEPKTNKSFEADLVYCLKNTNQTQDQHTLLFIHIEHQSTPDKNMPFRIAHYQTAQIASYMKENINKDSPPQIISFIYYQGVEPWSYKINFKNCAPGLIIFINLSATSDEVLLTHQGIGEIEIFLKHIIKQDYKNRVNFLSPGLQNCNDRWREILLKYLACITEFSEDEFTHIVESCAPKSKGVVMTLAERWIEKGIEKGITEGQKRVALKMLKDGMEERIIARLTDLSAKDVSQLKKSIQH